MIFTKKDAQINGQKAGLVATIKANEMKNNPVTPFAIILICTICFLDGCVVDTFDSKLIVVNATPNTIFIDLSKSKSFESHPVPIDEVNGDTLWNYARWIPPMDSLNGQPPFGSWERYINGNCTDRTLTIFIFDSRLLKSVPRDSLVSNQIYSRKYSYKVRDLEKLNWRIEFKQKTKP